MAEAIVEFDYKAQAPDELTIKKGDLITEIKVQPGGWWLGTLSRIGKRGLFPDNFVKLVGDTNQDTKPDGSHRGNSGRRCKVLFSYKPKNDDELELLVGDIIEILGEEEEGWWKGKLKNQVGVFPSNFVCEIMEPETEAAARKPKLSQDETIKQSVPPQSEMNSVQPSPVSAATNPEPGETPVLPPKPTKEVCRVMYAYEASKDDELTLQEGDLITLITKEGQDVGWWKGELKGKIGVFPDNFVQIISSHFELTKPDRPAKVVTTNRIRDTITKSVPSNSITTSVSKKFSDASKPPEDKASPPSVSKKPTLPPPPHKKPLRSPNSNELVKSSTSPSLAAPIKQPDSPTGPSPSRIPLTGLSPTNKLVSSSVVTETSSTLNNRWSVIENDSLDGALWSRNSYSVTSSSTSNSTTSHVMGINISGEFDLDIVGRSAMLTHPTASRARVPKRRPPSTLLSKEESKEESDTEAETLVNGNAEVPFEKQTPAMAPWVEELKLNQAKKTMQGKTRVLIGPAQSEVGGTTEVPSSKPAAAVTGVTLRSQQLVGQRPHSMFSSSKPSPPSNLIAPTLPPSDEMTVTVSAKQWTELCEKVMRLESHLEPTIEMLSKTIKELKEKFEEEKRSRLQMQQEIEKLTDLVTQV